jgi:anti-anti-sigma regulatory factor
MKASGGTCAFAALTPQVLEVFEMSGFLDVMEVHPSLEAATA